jgi:hypothetical protein
MEYFISSMNNLEDNVMRYMHRKYLKDKDIDYQDYKKTILGLKRLRIIDQTELLKKELNDIKEANRIHFKSSNKLDTNIGQETEYGYPDKFRCTYVINKKNNFVRCRRRIINGDASKYDCCLTHNRLNNIYLDKYLELCKTIV